MYVNPSETLFYPESCETNNDNKKIFNFLFCKVLRIVKQSFFVYKYENFYIYMLEDVIKINQS